MKIPEPNHSIQALIDKHHESLAEPPRPHMGCSQLGHPCDRWLWLSFRWAIQPQFPGRILRLSFLELSVLLNHPMPRAELGALRVDLAQLPVLLKEMALRLLNPHLTAHSLLTSRA